MRMLPQKLRLLVNNEKIRKFFIYGFGQAINLASPLLVIPYILSIIGESGLGRVGVGMSIAYILIVLIDYSSYIKGVRDIALNRDNVPELKKIIATNYLAKLILVIAVTFFFVLTCLAVPYLRGEAVLYFLSLFIVYGQFINPTWFLQGIEDFKSISAVNIASKVLYVAGVFIFVSKPEDYIYVNFLLGFGAVIPGLVSVWLIFRKYGVATTDFKADAAIKLIRDDFSFCVSQLLFAFRQYSPILIIDIFAGNIMAGQYKIIEQIIMLFRTYLQTMFKFLYSIISYEIGQNLEKGLKTWKKFNAYNIGFVLFLLIGIYIFSNQVFAFFKVTPHYLPLYNSMLNIAVFIPVFIGVTLAQEQLLFSFNKNKVYIKITIFITFFSVVAMLLFLKFFHLKGALMALLVTEMILMSIYFLLLKPEISRKNQSV